MAFFPSSLFKSADPSSSPRARVLMICMGNICRSPTAEAVLRHKLEAAGLASLVEVDSAGTHAYHVGSPPDPRALEAASRRGYEMKHLRARKVQQQDFDRFDLLLAMDWDNLALLEENCPSDLQTRRKLKRLTEFLPARSPHASVQTVPDPYYGGPAGFEFVLDLVEDACDGLVEHLRQVVASVASPP
ncbi:MAG: low molecular weight phosphotyrosine protein phosphatase [Aquabacterium sp.]|nr:low molecular weight phosphotyrosine protein phosphatase [Aquabacterium sp.]